MITELELRSRLIARVETSMNHQAAGLADSSQCRGAAGADGAENYSGRGESGSTEERERRVSERQKTFQ
jgi:hypothetical protein